MKWRAGWRQAGAAALLACLGASMAMAQTPCGEAVPCVVAGSEYRITGVQRARGVFVWFHGYRSSAAERVARRSLTQAVTDRGLAFAAVQGLEGTWAHPTAVRRARDETVFVEGVVDDLAARYGFGSDQVILGGFSQGASMALRGLRSRPAGGGRGDRFGQLLEPDPQPLRPRYSAARACPRDGGQDLSAGGPRHRRRASSGRRQSGPRHAGAFRRMRSGQAAPAGPRGGGSRPRPPVQRHARLRAGRLDVLPPRGRQCGRSRDCRVGARRLGPLSSQAPRARTTSATTIPKSTCPTSEAQASVPKPRKAGRPAIRSAMT